MSLSVRVRFEVFKRDRFTCTYCGKHPPDVLLEADHIVPRAAGGSDTIENLTTACTDCNQGKSDRLLEEGAPTVTRAKVDDLRERVEQASEYAQLVGQQSALAEKQVRLVLEVWATAFRADSEERSDGSYWVFGDRGDFPNDRSVRMFVRRLPLNEIVAAVDLTASRHPDPTDYARRFFYKVCWNRMKGGPPIDEPVRRPMAAVEDVDGDAESEIEYLRERLRQAEARIDDLEDENGLLRAKVDTLREDRGRSWKSVSEILREIER